MKKRGLSPIIATVLLISLTLIIAVIIFISAKSLISEKLLKFGEPIENSCERVNFNAEPIYSEGKINFVNRGNVPIYGIEIKKKNEGSVKIVKSFSKTIKTGETIALDLPNDLSQGEDIILTPILLGETKDSKQPYTCDNAYGITTKV